MDRGRARLRVENDSTFVEQIPLSVSWIVRDRDPRLIDRYTTQHMIVGSQSARCNVLTSSLRTRNWAHKHRSGRRGISFERERTIGFCSFPLSFLLFSFMLSPESIRRSFYFISRSLLAVSLLFDARRSRRKDVWCSTREYNFAYGSSKEVCICSSCMIACVYCVSVCTCM